MPDWDDERGEGAPGRRHERRLGRLSVFVVGLLMGFTAGAFAGAAAWVEFAPRAAAAVSAALSPPRALIARPAAPPVAPPPTLHATAGQPLRIGVFGDSLGDGLWAGLYRRLHGDKRFAVSRFSQAATGLTRYDYIDVNAKTAGQLEGETLDVAVVLFGANDEQAISAEGVIHPFGSDGWRAIYSARMAALVTLLRQHGAAVYWVGLPKMRRADYDARAGVLNAVYEAQARAMGAPFIPTVAATVDSAGAYEDYLPSESGGRPVLMRARDGIHMTMEGYLRLAGPVAARLQADLPPASAPSPSTVALAAAPVASRP